MTDSFLGILEPVLDVASGGYDRYAVFGIGYDLFADTLHSGGHGTVRPKANTELARGEGDRTARELDCGLYATDLQGGPRSSKRRLWCCTYAGPMGGKHAIPAEFDERLRSMSDNQNVTLQANGPVNFERCVCTRSQIDDAVDLLASSELRGHWNSENTSQFLSQRYLSFVGIYARIRSSPQLPRSLQLVVPGRARHDWSIYS